MKKNGKIFILSGPSGSGKTSLYKKLLENPRGVVKAISVTTRLKRRGEEDGRDYFFVSQRMFFYKKRRGFFLETQKVFDHYYGTPKKCVADFLRKSKNVLLCVDVKGAKIVRRKFPEAVSIFIKTPSLIDLKKRLQRRGSENQTQIEQRLKIARKELKESSAYNYVVINRDLKKAAEEIRNIIVSELRN